MADDLRMGLEMEFHGIVLTFINRRTKDIWPDSGYPPTTLLGENAILVPENDANFILDGRTNWESDWGFRAVGDGFGWSTALGKNGCTCILELATAANTYGNHAYWTSSRLCAKEFVEAINNFKLPGRPRAIADGQYQWYPLFDFVDLYNQRVDVLQPRVGFDKSKFKLKPSIDVVSLASGTFPGQIGQNWDAVVSTNHQLVKPYAPPFCDVQINYQIDLEWLDQNTDSWIALWNSMWATKISTIGQPLDPNIGLPHTTPSWQVYRTQIFAALWRAAKARATALTAATPPAALHAVRGLITYLIAAGSISVEETGGSTSKNSIPQLPKTSPASLTRLIAQLHDVTAILQQLTTAATLATVKTDISSLRVLSNLIAPPGQFVNLRPQQDALTYPELNDRMLTGRPNLQFDNMWSASLNAAGPVLDRGNLFGFTTAQPFYCAWAGEIKTSYPATRRGATGIKMLFEGRYGTDKLNIGFNPYAKDFMFNRSYLSIVRTLAPQASVAAAETAINQMFPDNPAIQQNFPQGYGPH